MYFVNKVELNPTKVTKAYLKSVCKRLDVLEKRALETAYMQRSNVNADSIDVREHSLWLAESLVRVSYYCNSVINMAEAIINIPGRVEKYGVLHMEFVKRVEEYNNYIRTMKIYEEDKWEAGVRTNTIELIQ